MNDLDLKKTHKGLFGIVTVLVAFVAVLWYSGVIEGDPRKYEIRPEIRPEIRIPEYRSDAARAIDAYERMMERYMTLSERNLGGIETDLKSVVRKLDSIEGQLMGLSVRMGRIEKALGIEPAKPAIREKKTIRELDGKSERAPLPGGAKMPEQTR